MKRMRTAFLAILLLGLLSPIAVAASLTISVRPESQVQGPWLTLGDIATVSGDSPERVKLFRELALGDAPKPGMTEFMTPASLEPKLAANRVDFSSIAWNVPTQFKVTTQSQPVSGRQIAEIARSFLSQTAVGSTVNLLELPADVQVPAGKLELAPELYGAIRYNGQTTVNVSLRTDGRSFVKVPVQFEVRRVLDVVVAAANLNAGDILTEQSVRLERMDVGKLAAGYLTELNKAVGQQVRYAMPPGSVLSERNLSRPILIKRGENIRIVARVGELEVFANGVTFSQGAAGDLVRVQNTVTKRIMTGRVQEDKSVLVLNQSGG